MNRYGEIIEKIVSWGQSSDQLHAAVIFGSQARSDNPPDEYSDLDILMVADDPDRLAFTDSWVADIGCCHVSFTEDSFGGGKERRVLFDNALDVDFCFLSPAMMRSARNSEIFDVFKRGCRVLFDKINVEQLIKSEPPLDCPYSAPSEYDFKNLVQNFWFHTIWAAKKLNRGELWMAKHCLDNYMKQLLLSMIEHHARAVHGIGYDTWHGGRFLDAWADEWIVHGLKDAFAHYDATDMKKALISTMDLFRQVAVKTAEALRFAYPAESDKYATDWVKQQVRV